MTGLGGVEVETAKGKWVPMREFLDLLDHGSCKWTNSASAVSDKRYWLNRTEWISEEAWDDPEIQNMYGKDPDQLTQLMN